jgi:hypothetical protein
MKIIFLGLILPLVEEFYAFVIIKVESLEEGQKDLPPF